MTVPYNFNKTATFDQIKKSLIQNGVACITEFLSDDEVSMLKNEVEILLNTEHPHKMVDGECRLARFKTDEIKGLSCHEILEKTNNDFFVKLATDFYKPYNPEFNKVYCHHDVKRMSYNSAWHYDRGLSLKFFFYLNDVDSENGAFAYDLGSHRANLVKQHLCWESNMPMLNYVPEDEVLSGVPIEGPAGTLIIFDNSGYHRAGTITNGGERWVVRFHTRSGKHLNGDESEKNPYARRNWEYRSACYSEREEEAKAPWTRMIKDKKIKNNENNKQENSKPSTNRFYDAISKIVKGLK